MNKLFAAVLSSAALFNQYGLSVYRRGLSISQGSSAFRRSRRFRRAVFPTRRRRLSNGFGGCFTTADSKTEAPALYSASKSVPPQRAAPTAAIPEGRRRIPLRRRVFPPKRLRHRNPGRMSKRLRTERRGRFQAGGKRRRQPWTRKPRGRRAGISLRQRRIRKRSQRLRSGKRKRKPRSKAARAPGRDLPPAKADQEPVPKASVRKRKRKPRSRKPRGRRAGISVRQRRIRNRCQRLRSGKRKRKPRSRKPRGRRAGIPLRQRRIRIRGQRLRSGKRKRKPRSRKPRGRRAGISVRQRRIRNRCQRLRSGKRKRKPRSRKPRGRGQGRGAGQGRAAG